MSFEDVRVALYECILRKRVLRPFLAASAPMLIICSVIKVAIAVFYIDPMSVAVGLAVCFFAVLTFAGGSYKELGWSFVILALPHVLKLLLTIVGLVFFRLSIPFVFSHPICTAVYTLLSVWSFKAAARTGAAA